MFIVLNSMVALVHYFNEINISLEKIKFPIII
jgi:hypothetical protein